MNLSSLFSKLLSTSGNGALRHWLGQRITAVVMALFTFAVLAQLIFRSGPLGYDRWASIFFAPWMRVLTVLVFIALAWHVWLGMREIYRDYIKPAAIKKALHVFTAAWLVACVAWVSYLLWRI